MSAITQSPTYQPGERVLVVWTDGSRKLGIVECAYPGRYLVSFAPGQLLWVLASYVVAA